MNTVDLILLAIGIACIAIIFWRLVVAWLASHGTFWQRFLLQFRNSETILWAWLQALIAGVLGLFKALSDMSGDPTISGAVQTILKPVYMPYYALGLAVITYLVRMHRTEPASDGTIDTAPPAPKGR